MPRPEPTVFERHPPRPEVVEAALAKSRDGCWWTEDAPGARHPARRGATRTDLAVVGGGFAGLWTAVRAKERDPGRRVVLLEGRRLGWAASGRNGGFCDASLTHGEDNGRSRWPEEFDVLDRLGRQNLAALEETVVRHRLDVSLERTGQLEVAVEEHQVGWLREAAARGGRFLDTRQVRDRVGSPTYLAGRHSDDTVLVHPARLVAELARLAIELGVEIAEGSVVRGLEADRRTGPVTLRLDGGRVSADRVALATNVFPTLLRRWRPFTVPVYDYVVVTDPLTADQRAAIGWAGREGMADLSHQFHYYRLTPDDRILFGGYDAIYRYGKRVKAAYEQRPESYRRLVSHLLTTFPQLDGIGVSHRWAGAIDTSTRFCAFWDTALDGRVAHTAGFTGLGVGATRFAGDVLLDLLDGAETERTRLEMVRRRPLPFPPEPLASLGIQATRWSLDRADHRRGQRNLWLRTLDRAGLGFDS